MSEPSIDLTGPAIELRGVAKRFGPTQALAGVDLTVARGEFVCVTGPSGAGKSTLLHLLAALERPDAGTIVVDGLDLAETHRLTLYRRERIGLVFQLHNLVPNLTARQNVELAMFGVDRHRRARTRRADELLERVGLAALADARPPMMSGGERQRVAIARALANRAPVLLADEPTGSLDDDSAAQVIELFGQLRRDDNRTILAVSHDARLTDTADRVVRLVRGKVATTEPTVDEPTVDEPTVADAPVADAPVADAPVADAPVADAGAARA